MKVLVKILFESAQEYQEYQQRMLPSTEARVVETLPKKEPEKIPVPDAEPAPLDKNLKQYKCQYWNCKKQFDSDEANPLYCSEKCEKKDLDQKEQNKKLAAIKAEIPIKKRGRPCINRDN